MKEFKNYERKFERVFTGESLIKKKCNLDDVSVFSDYYNVSTFIGKLKELTRSFDLLMFDFLVKYTWLTGKFCWHGHNKKLYESSGATVNRAFGVFMRYHVGFDNRLVSHPNVWLVKVASYLKEFFPDLMSGDPFKQNFEFPFNYMSLSCLCLVSEMNERLELLKYGEEKKMNFAEFSDYVVNYINCYNEENGGEYYTFVFSNRVAPYIKKKKK